MERSRRLVNGEEELELISTGEEGVLLIKALCGLTRVVSNVNIPNTYKQISNLPENAIVETNALFERDAIRPIHAGALPDNILSLIKPHVENHERIMQAATEQNTDLVVEAFCNDPLVKGRAERKDIEALVNDMMAATL